MRAGALEEYLELAYPVQREAEVLSGKVALVARSLVATWVGVGVRLVIPLGLGACEMEATPGTEYVVTTVYVPSSSPTPVTVGTAPVTSIPVTPPVGTPTSVPDVTATVEAPAIPAVESSGRAVPILGGTLTVASTGEALVVDPDRDRLFIVDVEQAQLVHEVAFSDGDEPSRLVENGLGSAFVVMRRGGAVVEVDLAEGSIVQRVDVCSEPRGVALDENGALITTCLGGELVRIETDGTLTRLRLAADDLRDVIVEAPYYLVSRFKSSELLVVNRETGVIHDRLLPDAWNDTTVGNLGPTTAFKMNRLDDGRVVVQHQRANRGSLVPVYYGPVNCAAGIVHSMVSVLDRADYPEPSILPSTETVDLGASGAPGALDAGVPEPSEPSTYVPSNRKILRFAAPSVERMTDFAVDASGENYIAITSPGPTSEYRTGAFVEIADGQCPEELPVPYTVEGQATAVAFALDGTPLLQTREPAALHVLRTEGAVAVTLSEDSRADAGHYLFHARTESGLACSSCHPEGGEDGNIWNFAGLGQRRTQALWGGLSQTAPFHWAGEHADLDALLLDTLTGRMRGTASMTLPGDMAARLGRWLDTIAAPNGSLPLDEALARGRSAFEKAECNGCHSGGAFTDNTTHDVGTGGRFQTPSLLGLRFRGPFLHNGCAKTLEERFTACGGSAHGKPDLLGEEELADLVGYLKSL